MATVYITPDLGWADVASMMDPAQNPLLQTIEDTSMDAATGTDVGYIGHNHKTITIDGTLRDIPNSLLRNMSGNDVKYYYRSKTGSTWGTLRKFTLLLTAPPIEED